MGSNRWTEADVARYLIQQGRPVPTLPGETPEGTLLAEIRKLATPYGWRIYHTHDSRKSESGFPDLCMTNGTDLLMYELKDNQRKPTAAQETWLALLAHTGKVECGVWRPKDWHAITARLTRGISERAS